MRKMALTLLAGLMLCCFAACGSSDAKNVETTEPTQIATTPVQVKVEETDPAAVLERIASDFSDTIENIVQKQEEMFAQVGTTYADYEKNKGMLDEWIELTLAEVDDLFARTREYSVAWLQKTQHTDTMNFAMKLSIIIMIRSMMMQWMTITMTFMMTLWMIYMINIMTALSVMRIYKQSNRYDFVREIYGVCRQSDRDE